MNAPEIQSTLLEAVKKQLPADQNPVDILAPILNLNKNAVYKRLSGATMLSLEDMVALTRHFRLPLAQYFYQESPGFEVTFSGFEAKVSSLEYLNNLENDLDQLLQLTKPKIKYVSIGLPDFYFFLFDELAFFQIFTWERLIWNNPEWQSRKFSFEMTNKDSFLIQTRRLANRYTQVEVTEFWSEYILDNFFQQLHYIVESKLFEQKKDIIDLLNCSKELIGHLRKMAMSERRFLPNSNPQKITAPFHLYYSEIMKNNIMLLIEAEEVEMIYAVVDNPNFIKTADPKMVNHIRKAFGKLQKRAIPLGEQGERYRDVYFEKLEKRQAQFENKIWKLLA